MSDMLKIAAVIAGVFVVSACSNLTAYRTTPSGDNYSSSTVPAAPVTRMPDKVEGSSGPAVRGPTGG
jgi:hypothetical protein